MSRPNDPDALRDLLQRRASALRGEILAKRDEAAGSLDDLRGGNDAGDVSAFDSAREVDLAEAERDTVELRAIGEALRRLDEGVYGLCADCGADIAAERLQVQPLASRCTACQQRAERSSGARAPSL